MQFYLSLQSVKVWELKSNYLCVAVTLFNWNNVVTIEQLCKNNPIALLEAAIRAMLIGISDIAEKSPTLRLLQVKRHTLEETGQWLVYVMVEVGEGRAARNLSVVAKAAESTAVEAAVRTTFNVLNRMVIPHSITPTKTLELVAS